MLLNVYTVDVQHLLYWYCNTNKLQESFFREEHIQCNHHITTMVFQGRGENLIFLNSSQHIFSYILHSNCNFLLPSVLQHAKVDH
jgi:hypothetical protein